MELGSLADLNRAIGSVRSSVRFPWRVRALLATVAVGYLFIGVVLLIGADRWSPSTTLNMVERVSPFRTWGCGALFVAGSAIWSLWRSDTFVARLSLVGSAGFCSTWAASFVAAWIAGESRSPVGIAFCGMLAVWSIVLAGVPFTDPIREAAYGVVHSVTEAADLARSGRGREGT